MSGLVVGGAAPWLLALTILVGVSPLWTPVERTGLIGALPLFAGLLGVLPLLGALVAGGSGIVVGAWVALLAGLPLGVLAVWVWPRRGLSRAGSRRRGEFVRPGA